MLLSRETIKLMIRSQKMVLKEFDVRIDLDNDQAIAMFLAYASQSSSVELKECTNRLVAQLLPDREHKAREQKKEPKQHVRYYRGQMIKEPLGKNVDSENNLDKINASGVKQPKEVIYRGQKVII